MSECLAAFWPTVSLAFGPFQHLCIVHENCRSMEVEKLQDVLLLVSDGASVRPMQMNNQDGAWNKRTSIDNSLDINVTPRISIDDWSLN